jgi:hypothetical protein
MGHTGHFLGILIKTYSYKAGSGYGKKPLKSNHLVEKLKKVRHLSRLKVKRETVRQKRNAY